MTLHDHVLALGAFGLIAAHLLWARRAQSRLEAAERRHDRLAAREVETSRSLELEKEERARVEQEEQLLRAIVSRLPWMIQELMECHDAREIPSKALDLIQELFAPRYVAFFARSADGFVATQVRGETEIALRSELGPRDGVVPWAAGKQLVLTPEDVASETGVMKAEFFTGAECAFSFCIPVVVDAATRAVILVGPSDRVVPSAADFARAVGVMTAHSLRSKRDLAQKTRLAETDGLTGLLNKAHVQEYLQQHLQRGMAESLGVFIFDIDNFKHYNDRNGHPAGDELLRSLGELLRAVTRKGEVLGRYGGEEFLLLMPAVSKEQALAGAERVRFAIDTHPFRFAEGQPLGKISISGGIAAFPEDGRNAGELIAAADRALYEAKRQGRDRVLAYRGADQVMKEDGEIERGSHEGREEVINLDEPIRGGG
jgi:diguanylate cyclase (GGDEF)-like protein